MSEEKFTPKPWSVLDRGYGYSIEPNIAWLGDKSSMSDEMNRANADLMCAAPDMYELLMNLHGALSSVPLLQEEIEKALKKARGEK